MPLPPSRIRVAIDAVVFAYQDAQLRVALIQNAAHQHALPGGFVRDGEGLREAVERELLEEVGLNVNYLEQLFTYGDDVSRDPRGQVITVAYWALVRPSAVISAASSDASHAKWTALNEVPPLAFDHNQIVTDALARLRAKLSYRPVGFDLLPAKFGFSELEQLYSTILGRPVDRRNFRRKVLSFGILKDTGTTRSEGAGRPATLYRFDQQRYQDLEREGFMFDIK